MNTEDFVTYEQAAALKKLGYNGSTDYYYNTTEPYYHDFKHLLDIIQENYENYVSAPTLAQALNWLYKEKGFIICYEPAFYSGKKPLLGFIYTTYNKDDGSYSRKESPAVYDTIEEALSAGITECLKILEKED